MSVNNNVKTGLGSKLSISTTAFTGTKDAAGYGAATYAQMKIEAFNKPGQSFESYMWRDLDTGEPTYVKGGKNYPPVTVSVADLPNDAALTALKSALADQTGEWALKAEHINDGTVTPRITYFTVRVMGIGETSVTTTGIQVVPFTFQPTSPSVVVAAT